MTHKLDETAQGGHPESASTHNAAPTTSTSSGVPACAGTEGSTDNNAVHFTAAIGEHGEYELFMGGQYVGQIAYYDDARVVMHALKRAAVLATSWPEPAYRSYSASSEESGIYTILRDGRRVGEVLRKDVADRIIRAIVDGTVMVSQDEAWRQYVGTRTHLLDTSHNRGIFAAGYGANRLRETTGTPALSKDVNGNYRTGDEELDLLLGLTEDVLSGSGGMDAGLWWHGTLLRVLSRLGKPTAQGSGGEGHISIVPTPALADAVKASETPENSDPCDLCGAAYGKFGCTCVLGVPNHGSRPPALLNAPAVAPPPSSPETDSRTCPTVIDNDRDGKYERCTRCGESWPYPAISACESARRQLVKAGFDVSSVTRG